METAQSGVLCYDVIMCHDIRFCFHLCSVAQIKNKGLPYIRNFKPSEYKAKNQNWAIVQAPNGITYFGNNSGLLEYDGVSWRLIEMPNKSLVRSLAIDKDGLKVSYERDIDC